MNRFFLAVLAALCLLVHLPALAQCASVSWGAAQTQSSSGSIDRSVPLDLDNDGKTDLVSMIRRTNSPVSDLYSLKGHGDGTFDAPVSLGTEDLRDVQVADVNNDGRKDLVLSAYGFLVVRLGTASGLGAPIETYPSGLGVSRIAVGNFDGDAFPDLALASYDFGLIAIFHGVGNGTFTEIRRMTAATPNSIAVGDFDGDGRTDVAYTNRQQQSAYVAFRNADGTFSAPVALPAANYPNAVAAGDLNEDGKSDLVAVNWEDFTTLPLRSVMVYLAGASRTFTRSIMDSRIVNSTASYTSVQVADVNGDGHLDIVAASVNSGQTLTFQGLGNGTFRSSAERVAGDAWDVALADLDGDSRPDMILSSWNGFSTLKNNCATHVHLYSISPTITVGQTAPLRALVSAISSTTSPRGTVTFKEGTTVLGTADVDAEGTASLEVAGLPLGNHLLTAEFSGNGELAAATSLALEQGVTTDVTTVKMILPEGVVPTYGTPYLVDVDLRLNASTFPFNGWVMIAVDGVEVVEGYAGIKVPLNLSVGPHTLSARFFGRQYLPPGNSPPVNIVVEQAQATMSYSGALTVRQGTAHSFAFQVSGPAGTSPSGSVVLQRGGPVIASAPVVNGVANISKTLERGTHDVWATYSGDANFKAIALNLTLTVVPNAPVALEARAWSDSISIRVAVPPNATNITLYRRLGGTSDVLLPVNGWTPAIEFDSTAARGVLYDYRVEATVNGVVQASNIDSAIIFTDDGLASAQTVIHHKHFDELRLAVNALRANAGLAPFQYDNLFAGALVRATHLAALRNALTEARQALGMVPASYTDAAAAGTIVKAVQIQELRELAR